MVICFTLGALWPPSESEEDDGEAEEPEICTLKQFEFYWARTWLEEGGAHIVDEKKAKRLLSQVFLVFSSFFPFLWYWSWFITGSISLHRVVTCLLFQIVADGQQVVSVQGTAVPFPIYGVYQIYW